MAKLSTKQIVSKIIKYFILTILGSAIVIFAVALYKANTVRKVLKNAENKLSARKADILLKDIEKSQLWEPSFPALAMRRKTYAIRCHVSLTNIESAISSARDIYKLSSQRTPPLEQFKDIFKPSSESGIKSFEQRLLKLEQIAIDYFNNSFEKQNIQNGYNKMSGYVWLHTLLMNNSDIPNLNKLLDELSATAPNDDLTRKLKSYLAGGPKQISQKPSPGNITSPANRQSRTDNLQNPVKLAGTDISTWATVKSDYAKYYDRNGGAPLSSVANGTVLDISKVSSTPKGEIAVCTIHSPEGKISDVVFLTSDIEMKKGKLSDISKDNYNLLLERSTLMEKAVKIKDTLEVDDSNNPYRTEYHNVKKEFEEFTAKSSALSKTLSKSTGDTRMQLLEDLRKMKYEEAAAKQKFTSIKNKYSDWQNKNGGSNVKKTPEALELEGQINVIEEKLRAAKIL